MNCASDMRRETLRWRCTYRRSITTTVVSQRFETWSLAFIVFCQAIWVAVGDIHISILSDLFFFSFSNRYTTVMASCWARLDYGSNPFIYSGMEITYVMNQLCRTAMSGIQPQYTIEDRQCRYPTYTKVDCPF